MTKNSIFMSVSICFLFMSNLGDAAEIPAKTDECSKFEVAGELLSTSDLKTVNTSLKSLAAGKLFYSELSGYCVPTSDTYLVGQLNSGYPLILSVLRGHTPKAEVHNFNGHQILLVLYFTGGNQYILEPYLFGEESIERLVGPPLASNLRSIELVDDFISVKNQEYLANGELTVKTDFYRYRDDSFVLVENK